MAICKKIYRTSKKVCTGALNTRVVVNVRQILSPSGSSVDFDEQFIPERTVWGMVETTTGTVFFDDTNTAKEVSHNVYIRYIPAVTPEKWLLILANDGTTQAYYNILKAENMNNENRFYKLQCNVRGNPSIKVNEA